MSIEIVSKYGWYVSHEAFIKDIYKQIDNCNIGFEFKPELFKILSPFKQTNANHKQTKKSIQNSQENEEFEKEVFTVRQLFENFKKDVANKFNNESGCNKDTENTEALQTASLAYTESGKCVISNSQGGNNCEYATSKTLQGSLFLFPKNCTFYCKDVVDISSYLTQKYDLILLDPPWRNRYIRRKRKISDHSYKMMYDDDLQELSLENLLKDDGLLVVWCTNSKQHMKALLESIFKKWGVDFVTKWYWVKVTQFLETVCPFSKPPRKQPFEQIVFACKKGRFIDSLPCNKLVVSVPSAVHSHKPPLIKLLEPYLPENPSCLEVFARYLLPDFTSYGKEALRLQHESLYNKINIAE